MRSTLAINQPSMLPAAAESTKAAEIQATSTVKAEEKKGDDQVFGPGLGVLRQYMQLLTQLANEHHQKMKEHGDIANEAQEMVTETNALIAEIDSKEKQGGSVHLTDKLREYLLEHPEWRGDIGFNDGEGDWNKKELTKVLGVVQKYATENSDANSRYQSQIQKTMQTYNVTVSLMNSLQTMLGDMTKQFAQATR
ncbi:MAG: hypothetical protein AB2989_04870 [Candidatus Symbiodolus clandestinus]